MPIIRSYRWRRRLVISAILVAVAGPLTYLGVHYSTPGASTAPTGPEIQGGFEEQEKPAPFTKAKQRQVSHVLKEFISTAVAREHVADSYEIAGPNLRQGLTRKEWRTGNIPVQPYPVAHKGLGRWELVQYSFKDQVGLEVLVFPKPGSPFGPMSADVDVVRGRDGHWRVDYWMPKKFHGSPIAAKKHVKAAKKAKKRAHAPKPRVAAPREAGPRLGEPRARINVLWWALPVGLLALAVIIPLGVWGGYWYRNRRAEQAYQRSKE